MLRNQFVPGTTVRVELPPACVEFGGKEEYPDGRMGTVIIPEQFLKGAGSGEGRLERAEALYKSSAPVNREGLSCVAFPAPFRGKTRSGNPQVKTWSEGGRHVMWIPSWILVRPLAVRT